MNNNLSKFEFLPNETFIEIFQYFYIKDLFYAFNNLNIRFNNLLQSLNNLCYKLWDNTYIQNNDLIPFIDTLIIHSSIDIYLNHFTHIRHLKIIWLTDQLLKQLNIHKLIYLEYLFIKKLSCNSADILYNKIFSNDFPCLKSCYISLGNVIPTNHNFTQLPLLYNLEVGTIDLSIYNIILSLCPNLNFFKFQLITNQISIIIKPHYNLKRMIIKLVDFIQLNNDYSIDKCLSCVPNLEQLSIKQDFLQLNIPQYIKHDWYASLINRYLPLLKRFNYYFQMWYNTEFDTTINYCFDDIKSNFKYVHNDRYQSKLFFNLTC